MLNNSYLYLYWTFLSIIIFVLYKEPSDKFLDLPLFSAIYVCMLYNHLKSILKYNISVMCILYLWRLYGKIGIWLSSVLQPSDLDSIPLPPIFSNLMLIYCFGAAYTCKVMCIIASDFTCLFLLDTIYISELVL